jgi:hypothetical protein
MHVSARLGLAAFALLAAPAAAQFTLSLTDGRALRGAPAGLNEAGAVLWRVNDKVEAFARSDLIGFESDQPEVPTPPGGVRVELVGGDSLFGRLEDGPADELRMVVAGMGTLAFKLDDVAVLWNREGRGDAGVELPPSKGEDDDRLFVEIEGGLDSLTGTLERVNKAEVVFSSRAAGDKRPFVFARDKVVAVRLATDAKAKGVDRSCAVRFRDGSRATGTPLAAPNGGLALKLAAGPTATLDFAHVASVTFQGGSFVYLSDVAPTTFVETPFIAGGVTHGLFVDRGARPGEPLRIGEERFTKGLLLFAAAEATFALDGVARFTAKVGVDPETKARALVGSAYLALVVDGVEKWRSLLLSSGAPPLPVALDVKGAKSLKLVVSFGDSFDAGARVVVGNAMLLK